MLNLLVYICMFSVLRIYLLEPLPEGTLLGIYKLIIYIGYISYYLISDIRLANWRRVQRGFSIICVKNSRMSIIFQTFCICIQSNSYMPSYKGPAVLPEPEWYRKAATKMVREGKNLLLVVDEMGLEGLTSRDIESVHKSNTFQAILRNERLRFATEIARDPALSKDAAVGMMLQAIEKLMAEGEWDKALEGVTKLAKLAGWIGADQQVNVFADLKQKDYEELKKQIESRKSTTRTDQIIN